MAKSHAPKTDPVDAMVAAWNRERPDLDVTPSAVVIRIAMLAHAFGIELRRFFEANGLTKADFEVLAALRRRGEPYALPQHEIMHVSRRSSGTVSFRVDRLESDGFVRRSPDPGDARSVIVALTESGKRLVDRIAAAHLANEARLLAPLTAAERVALAKLLRKLVLHNLG
jgi:DNA-binding MarR family transcriptional regulator